MNKTIDQWLEEYGRSHQNPINKLIHWICVPLIMFSLIGLLWSIPFNYNLILNEKVFSINVPIIFLLVVIMYYFKLSKSLSMGMIFISFLLIKGINLLFLLNLSLWKSSLFIFVVAWIGQFIGHKIEGEKPSFFEDIQFLLIGPAWLLSFIYKKFNIPL